MPQANPNNLLSCLAAAALTCRTMCSAAVFVAGEGSAASACLICRKPTLQYNMLDCRQVECRFVLTVYLAIVCRGLPQLFAFLAQSLPLAPVLPSSRMAVCVEHMFDLSVTTGVLGKASHGISLLLPAKAVSLSRFPPQRLVLNRSRFENAPLRKTNDERRRKKRKTAQGTSSFLAVLAAPSTKLFALPSFLPF